MNIKYKLYYEGKTFSSNQYGDFIILEYLDTFHVKIKFLTTNYICISSLNNIKKGRVKDPFYPRIYGVGYIGKGEYKSRDNNGIQYSSYKVWKEILNRCYNPSCNSYLQYGKKGVIVDSIWQNYQNFAEWYNNNYKEGFVLDKDILVKRNLIYGPDYCCFVPKELNNLYTKRENKRGDHPIGVRKNGNKYEAQLNTIYGKKYLGIKNTPEEAFLLYKKAKEKYIKECADLYKDVIDKRVYSALYNYIVEIDD